MQGLEPKMAVRYIGHGDDDDWPRGGAGAPAVETSGILDSIGRAVGRGASKAVNEVSKMMGGEGSAPMKHATYYVMGDIVKILIEDMHKILDVRHGEKLSEDMQKTYDIMEALKMNLEERKKFFQRKTTLEYGRLVKLIEKRMELLQKIADDKISDSDKDAARNELKKASGIKSDLKIDADGAKEELVRLGYLDRLAGVRKTLKDKMEEE